MIDPKNLQERFKREFGSLEGRSYFSHGRLEILGNHTDHNGGLCLVAGLDRGITAIAGRNYEGKVFVSSEGFAPFSLDIKDLEKREEEKGKTIALVRGVLAGLRKLGYDLGGFSLVADSDIPGGSGLSSSACFEALIGEIASDLFNDGKITNQDLMFISQYAETVYFGKPCGLLDQVGCIEGGVSYVDFFDETSPAIEQLPFELPLKLVVVVTPSSHAGLDSLYAKIPTGMKRVAQNGFGINRLRDIDVETFSSLIGLPMAGVTETEKLYAQHFIEENRRVLDGRQAILDRNVQTLLHNVAMSQYSSKTYLQNTFVPGQYRNSPQEAVDTLTPFIGEGAIRITGGGFAGSVLCFVLPSDYEAFLAKAKGLYGEGAVIPVSFVEGGPKRL